MSDKPHVEMCKKMNCGLVKILIGYMKIISRIVMVKGLLNDAYAISFL